MTPGGRPSGARPPVAPRDGVPARKDIESVVHWSVVVGGLIIIADLVTRLLAQTSGATSGVGSAAVVVDYILNSVLYSVAGILVYRDTGQVRLALLAGLAAGVLDGAVVGLAEALSPTATLPPDVGPGEAWLSSVLWNGMLGSILAVASAWFGRLARTAQGR